MQARPEPGRIVLSQAKEADLLTLFIPYSAHCTVIS